MLDTGYGAGRQYVSDFVGFGFYGCAQEYGAGPNELELNPVAALVIAVIPAHLKHLRAILNGVPPLPLNLERMRRHGVPFNCSGLVIGVFIGIPKWREVGRAPDGAAGLELERELVEGLCRG